MYKKYLIPHRTCTVHGSTYTQKQNALRSRAPLKQGSLDYYDLTFQLPFLSLPITVRRTGPFPPLQLLFPGRRCAPVMQNRNNVRAQSPHIYVYINIYSNGSCHSHKTDLLTASLFTTYPLEPAFPSIALTVSLLLPFFDRPVSLSKSLYPPLTILALLLSCHGK